MTRPRTALLTLAVLSVAAIATARGAVRQTGVDGVRIGGDSQHTRIVVDLSAPAKGVEPGDAPPPHTVVLDLDGVGASEVIKGSGLGLVKAWTVKPRGGMARIELALRADAKVTRRFLIPPGDGVARYRYVLDLEPAPPETEAAKVEKASWLNAFVPAAKHPAPVKRLIVIDAGHGGKDPGAAGAQSQEKNLTLAAAEALKSRLERTGRYRVRLTRNEDVYIPLDDRVAIARRAGADLFISLHADSDATPGVRGASVYTLSEHGADRAQRKVLTGGDWTSPSARNGDPAVDRILLDLTQRATQNRSGAFARMLIDRLDGRTPILRRGQRDAGFAVLLAPDVPAVLLEMGFITNAEDEAAMNDPDDRAKLVDGIAEAVDDYFAADGGATSVAALP